MISIGRFRVSRGGWKGTRKRRRGPSRARCGWRIPAAEAEAVRWIDELKEAGTTAGGVVEVIATGVPPGLGSCVAWDARLDGRIGRALMSIHAIKGVEIGGGFGLAALARKGGARRGVPRRLGEEPSSREACPAVPPGNEPRGRTGRRDDERGAAGGPRRDEADPDAVDAAAHGHPGELGGRVGPPGARRRLRRSRRVPSWPSRWSPSSWRMPSWRNSGAMRCGISSIIIQIISSASAGDDRREGFPGGRPRRVHGGGKKLGRQGAGAPDRRRVRRRGRVDREEGRAAIRVHFRGGGRGRLSARWKRPR